MAAGKRYRVGQFLLDASDRTVRSNGTIHALTPKEFDFLLLLVEHPGEVVDKEKLYSTLWPDAIVSDGNLTQYVYRLRGLLGNEAIQTIPKKGYRLTAEVAGGCEAGCGGGRGRHAGAGRAAWFSNRDAAWTPQIDLGVCPRLSGGCGSHRGMEHAFVPSKSRSLRSVPAWPGAA